MQRDLVSVIMPVYNGSRYLRKAVESVLAQTHQAWELIAVDDGSSDESADILQSFGESVHVVRQSNCGNVGQVRDVGIQRSRGEFVAFLDQDDWWQPGKLARQIAEMRSDERVGLVHTDSEYFDDSRQSFVPTHNPLAWSAAYEGNCFEQLLMGNPIVNSSVVVRRTVLDSVGGCSSRLKGNTCQDYHLWIRMARVCRLAFVGEKLTVFRLHPLQGHNNLRAMLAAEIEVLLEHRPEREWRRSRAGRARLQQLFDELATAHFDAGDSQAACAAFARAFAVQPTARALARFSASCLPRSAATWARRLWQGIRQKRLALIGIKNVGSHSRRSDFGPSV